MRRKEYDDGGDGRRVWRRCEGVRLVASERAGIRFYRESSHNPRHV